MKFHLRSASSVLLALPFIATVTAQPVIDQHPVDQVVAIGGEAQFSVVASGTAPMSFQWRLGDIDLQGATQPLLKVSNAQPNDEGSYTVEVTDASGSTLSDPAALTLDRNWVLYNPTNSGLPYKGVVDLEIDLEGNLWVATGRWYAHEGGGVAQFDGQQWTVYTSTNSPLPDYDCTGSTLDASGRIWVSTELGLARYDAMHGWERLSRRQMWFPAFDLDGELWLGSSSGLIRYDGVSWTGFQAANSALPNDFVMCVVIDGENRKWIGTNDGLAVFDDEDWTVYTASRDGLPGNAVGAIAIDEEGTAWIGCIGRGMARFDGENWTRYSSANSGLPGMSINWILIDPNGVKWIATEGGGLARFDGTNWQTYNQSNSPLPDDYVQPLLLDRYGNLWIGMKEGGLAAFREGGVIMPLHMESLVADGDGGAVLRWTGGLGPYQVQSRASLNAGDWEDHGPPTAEQSVSFDIGAASLFFRVRETQL